MKHTIIVDGIDKEYVPSGTVSFTIDDTEKYNFYEYGIGEVVIDYIKDDINSGDYIYFVCSYPCGDNFWEFSLDIGNEEDYRGEWITYNISELVPDTVKNNIMAQLYSQGYIEEYDLNYF